MTGHSVSRAETLRVGRVEVPFDQAVRWVSDYTRPENSQGAAPYAFPAYDQLETGSQPTRLADADLLAPVLLNVRLKLRSFYALQAARPQLEAALTSAGDQLDGPLVDLSDEQLADVVAPLYAVLDDPDTKPWGVGATKLSKVLHRKAPEVLVLHDVFVRACYLGTDAVPRVAGRSWADYLVALTRAVRDDLADQREAFTGLAEQARVAGALTPVRLLDIVAWRSKGKSA